MCSRRSHNRNNPDFFIEHYWFSPSPDRTEAASLMVFGMVSLLELGVTHVRNQVQRNMYLIGMVLLLISARLRAQEAVAPPRSLPEMDQAAKDWLDSPGSAAFGNWLVKSLEGHQDHPEWVDMFADILQGSQLSARDGWFRRAIAQTRYPWQVLSQRYDTNQNGSIERSEFPGTQADFGRLDRDQDGKISPVDLAWPEHALAQSPGSSLYFLADTDSNGRVTREELLAFFDQADSDNLGFLALDDFKRVLPMPGSSRSSSNDSSARPSGPSKSTLIKGLFEQEIGSMRAGPNVGEFVPDFTLKTADGSSQVTLSEHIGAKPVVLVFGNITCGPFRTQGGNVEKLFRRYQDRANFIMVYVREAHPTDGWHMSFNDAFQVKLDQPRSYEERVGVAQRCQRMLGFEMPFLVDTIDDMVGGVYSGMPSRLYVIDREGKVAYKSGRGPFGFKTGEMEQALIWTLLESPVQEKASASVATDEGMNPENNAKAVSGTSEAKTVPDCSNSQAAGLDRQLNEQNATDVVRVPSLERENA